MTASTVAFADLSDDQHVAEVHRLAAAERCATAVLIRSLIELDNRPHLYLRDGCSSLFVYCTRVLHLAEGATYNRIEVARAARRFPLMLDALEDGSVTLTALRLLAPHLTDTNHRDVLGAARHKSKAEVERLIASLRPKPDVPAVIRMPERPHRVTTSVIEAAVAAEPAPARESSPAPTDPVPPPRAAVTVLSTER